MTRSSGETDRWVKNVCIENAPWLIIRECACPSVCEPLNVVSSSEPPQWHGLKNGICVVMSLTDCVCGDGSPNVASSVVASHRPGLMCFRTFGPPVTSTAAAAAY